MVSIIIPTYNEEKLLHQTLTSLKSLDKNHYEIIIADGGSSDNTLEIARSFRLRIVACKNKGRACQMNEGAKIGKGEILVFLHADTFISQRNLDKVKGYLSNEKLTLGGFTSIMKGNKIQWFLSIQNYLKTYLIAFIHRPNLFIARGYRMLFGDQVMFCRKRDFAKIGGFNEEFLLMEDAELCLRMCKLGKIRQFRQRVYSSDRRVLKWGFMAGYFRYLKILFWYVFIGNPSNFIKEYDDER